MAKIMLGAALIVLTLFLVFRDEGESWGWYEDNQNPTATPVPTLSPVSPTPLPTADPTIKPTVSPKVTVKSEVSGRETKRIVTITAEGEVFLESSAKCQAQGEKIVNGEKITTSNADCQAEVTNEIYIGD